MNLNRSIILQPGSRRSTEPLSNRGLSPACTIQQANSCRVVHSIGGHIYRIAFVIAKSIQCRRELYPIQNGKLIVAHCIDLLSLAGGKILKKLNRMLSVRSVGSDTCTADVHRGAPVFCRRNVDAYCIDHVRSLTVGWAGQPGQIVVVSKGYIAKSGSNGSNLTCVSPLGIPCKVLNQT